MRFKFLTFSAIFVLVLANFLMLPQILHNLRSSPQIQKYVANPDVTFQLFSQCKILIADASACYQAYSAAIEIANSKECSAGGIAMKRKFKQLIEHGTAEAIEIEILRECSPIKDGSF